MKPPIRPAVAERALRAMPVRNGEVITSLTADEYHSCGLLLDDLEGVIGQRHHPFYAESSAISTLACGP